MRLRMGGFKGGLALVAALVVMACGGGGGGSASQPSPTLSLTTTSVAFNAYANDAGAPPAQVVYGTIANASTPIYLFVSYTNQALSHVAFSQTGQTTGQLVITPKAPALLGPGTFADTITVRACLDSAGTQNISGSPRTIAVSYQVSPRVTGDRSTLNFLQVVGSPAPGDQTVQLAGTGQGWRATTNQGWIRIRTASGTAPGSLALGVDPTGLAIGSHTGTVTVSTDGSPATFPIAVHLEVQPLSLQTGADTLTFSGVNGAPLPAQLLSIALNSGDIQSWSAVAGAPWITLQKTSGTTPDTLAIGVNPGMGPLASGAHASTVTLSCSVNGTVLTRTVAVQLGLTAPVFSFNPSSLTLGGPNGRDLSPQTLQVGLNTGAGAFAWTASGNQAWIVPGATAGTASGASTPLTVTVNAAALQAGSHSGHLTFSAQVNGDTVTGTLPIAMTLDARRILASDTGIALASMPTLKTLSRTLTLRDNWGQAVAWTAASSQSWLSVTSDGTTPGNLVVTANPEGLAPDTIHYGTITVASPAPGIGQTETIQVGFWVGATDPQPATTVSQVYKSLVLDPIRPLAYVHTGSQDITIYNIYTCAIVGTISGVGGTLGDMTVSLDGSSLFVADNATFKVIPVSLTDRSVGTPWPLASEVPAYLQYARTNGTGLILAGDGTIYRADSGTSFGIAPQGSNRMVAASLLGNEYSLDGRIHSLDHSTLAGEQVRVGPARLPLVEAWNTGDYAFNEDGSHFYMAVGAPYFFYVVDTATLLQVRTLPGSSYPTNLEVARDGRIFGGTRPYGTDVWVYAPDGSPLATYQISYLGPVQRQMKVSGDGLRLVAISAGPYLDIGESLVFTTVAP